MPEMQYHGPAAPDGLRQEMKTIRVIPVSQVTEPETLHLVKKAICMHGILARTVLSLTE